jgi:eukaryotic-like serine/threonine-protein kinase
MKIEDVHAIAMEAAARGWISHNDVWAVALRWALQGNKVDAHDLFARILDTEKLKTLSSERSTADTMANAPGIEAAMSLPPPSTVVQDMPGRIAGPRYTLRETLGSGGVGDVVAALDREIRRVVALKTLQRSKSGDWVAASRFVEEARITAQLEHPNIIPVYDLGAAPDGQPYYTMRVVKRRSLRDVLARPALREQWPMVRLLGIFLQVTRALAYAHSRGVVHRDIKPENVLLGDFGEVYVADWGIALLQQGKSNLHIHGDGSVPPPQGSGAAGTPGYMAPEILKGDWDIVDHRIDIFALGVVLYEMLTGAPPFPGRITPEIILATCTKDPQPPRALVPSTPLLLEDLCLQLLAKNPDDRPPSCDAVIKQVEDFLEGAKERERRRIEAQTLCVRAQETVTRYAQLADDQQRLAAEAEKLLEPIKGWEAVDKKRPGWQKEDLAERSEKEAALVLAEAIELYTKALGYDADCEEAHKGLADLYWSRARSAESERAAAEQVYYEALVTEHDQGKYTAILRADAVLSLRSNPTGSHVIAQRFIERDRILAPADERYLGRTPIREARLEPGSYLLTVKGPGFRDARYPVLLRRGTHHDGEVTLYTEDEIGEGFVFVPGGVATLGGDEEAYNALPGQEHHVSDFAIARVPITFREYCAFLDALPEDEAARRLPRDTQMAGGGLLVERVDGRWQPAEGLIEGEARKMFPRGDGHYWNVPVCLVDWFDARAFARSRNARLPNELEWEKAARGVDGRVYPWGDRFDPTFCKMRDSRPFTQQPEPIGTFPPDESPYGVRDLAGGMREWVGDIFGERSATELDAEAEPPAGTERGESTWREIRGGNWNQDHKWARAASRGGSYALARGTGLGFRLAKTLARRGAESTRPGEPRR